MAWKCPVCDYPNFYNDTTCFSCGYALKTNDRLELVDDPQVSLTSRFKGYLVFVLISYALALISFGTLPGALFIEPFKSILIFIRIFPNAPHASEGWWWFYIVFDVIWPLTLLFGYFVSEYLFLLKTKDQKFFISLATIFLSTYLLAFLCFLAVGDRI